MANHPASYFIHVGISQNDVPGISIENVKTQEKLVIEAKIDHGKWKNLLISRYPLNAAKSWIEANEKEITEWGTPICICSKWRQIIFHDQMLIAM
jgi:hypothetical protein